MSVEKGGEAGRRPCPRNAMKKSETKAGVDRSLKALREKAHELRHRMSAEKAAAIVSRLEDPSDSGDLSQQSHEEWLFLNRNNHSSWLCWLKSPESEGSSRRETIAAAF